MKKTNKPTITRKIDEETINEMAKLMSKRITETGACLMLGIIPQSWFNWKGRNASKFSDALLRARETKLAACIDAIDEAGDGDAARGIKADWRAKAFIVERVLAPERYGKAGESAPPAPVVNIAVLDSLSRLVYSVDSPPARPMALPTGETSGQA